MPQSAKVDVQFDRNFDVQSHQDIDDDHAKSTTELNNGCDFSAITYEEVESDLFIDNSSHAGYKRESDHR